MESGGGFEYVAKPLGGFVKNSVRLIKRCTKPDQKEFTKICLQTALGFCVLGFVGFFVKLLFIPINQIIIGA